MTDDQNKNESEVVSTAPGEEKNQPVLEEEEEVREKPKREWTFNRVLVLSIILLILGGIVSSSAKPVDDAYITFRFAENLVHGHGFSFNPGTKVEGFTSFGQVLLMAPFALIGKGAPWLASVIIGVLSWAFLIALSWRFIRRERQGELDRPDWFFLIYLATCNPAVIWAWSGMEAPLFSLAWLGAWLLHQKEYESDQLPYWSALVTFGAGLLHPEGILIAVVLGASWFLPFNMERAKKGAAYLGIAVGLFGLYWLWRWSYFGFFFPNTFYAKVGSAGGLFASGLRYVLIAAMSTIMPLYLLYLIVRRWFHLRELPRWVFLAAGMVGILVAYNIYVGGDYFSYQRFLLPTFSFLFMILYRLWWDHREAKAAAREKMLQEMAEEHEGDELVEVHEKHVRRHPLLWALIIVMMINVWSGFYKKQGAQHKVIQRVVPEFTAAGKVVAAKLPKKATVATIPIGAFGYFSERPILDLAGLTDVHTAHLKIKTGQRNVGHEKFDYEYVFQQRPEMIVRLPALFPLSEDGLNEWLMVSTINPLQYRIYDYPQLQEEYRLAWLPVKKIRLKYTLIDLTDLAKKRGIAGFPIEKMPVRARRTAGAELQEVGIYGFVRRDVITNKDFNNWRAVSTPMNNRVFQIAPLLAKVNPMRKQKGTLWQFSGGEDTGLPDVPESAVENNGEMTPETAEATEQAAPADPTEAPTEPAAPSQAPAPVEPAEAAVPAATGQ